MRICVTRPPSMRYIKCAANFTEIEVYGNWYKHVIWWIVCLLKDWIITKLMSRRHADNWSHPGHYLVDPYTWPWSPNGHRRGHDFMNDLLPPHLYNVNRPTHSGIQLFQKLTMKIHGQGHVCGQRWRSRLTFKSQRSRLWSRSNTLVTVEALGSTDMFAFRFVPIGPFLADK